MRLDQHEVHPREAIFRRLSMNPIEILRLPAPVLGAVVGHCATTPLLQLYQSSSFLRHLAVQEFRARVSMYEKMTHIVPSPGGNVTFVIDPGYNVKEGIRHSGDGFMCHAQRTEAGVAVFDVVIRKIGLRDESDCRYLLTELRAMRHLDDQENIHGVITIMRPPPCGEWRDIYIVQPYFCVDMGRIIRSQQVSHLPVLSSTLIQNPNESKLDRRLP